MIEEWLWLVIRKTKTWATDGRVDCRWGITELEEDMQVGSQRKTKIKDSRKMRNQYV